MFGTPPIFNGMNANTAAVLQEGSYFTDVSYGLDSGSRKFLCHPDLSTSYWPQLGDPDSEYVKMYVEKVTPRLHESTLIELEVEYAGQTSDKDDFLTPSTDTRVFSYEADGINTEIVNTINVELPVPTLTREYVSFTLPSYTGVGQVVTIENNPFLYAPGALGFTISSTSGQTLNLLTGWVLGSRAPVPIIPGKVWLVTEQYHYNYALA